jgi:hypothetical protein
MIDKILEWRPDSDRWQLLWVTSEDDAADAPPVQRPDNGRQNSRIQHRALI